MESRTSVEAQESAIKGEIQSIINHGTIVQMLIKTDDGSICYVNFDHRCFRSMVEDMGTVNLKGQRVIIHGEPFEQSVEFPDLMEDEP